MIQSPPAFARPANRRFPPPENHLFQPQIPVVVVDAVEFDLVTANWLWSVWQQAKQHNL